MITQEKHTQTENSMSVMEAIHQRHSVRNYTMEKIDQSVIRALLEVAVHAPTAMHEEPWSFVIIQDKNLLNRLSESVKERVRAEAQQSDSTGAKRTLDLVNEPDFNVFYNAGTLILICSKIQGQFVEADCWLAAENLMLAACSKGLGSCVIGFAVSALNTPEWKTEFKIPIDSVAIAPIILGVPGDVMSSVNRKPPEILLWK